MKAHSQQERTQSGSREKKAEGDSKSMGEGRVSEIAAHHVRTTKRARQMSKITLDLEMGRRSDV